MLVSQGILIARVAKTGRLRYTYSWNKKLLDFVDGSLELNLGSVFGVFNRDQNVQFVIQVLPVGFSLHLVLLKAMAQSV